MRVTVKTAAPPSVMVPLPITVTKGVVSGASLSSTSIEAFEGGPTVYVCGNDIDGLIITSMRRVWSCTAWSSNVGKVNVAVAESALKNEVMAFAEDVNGNVEKMKHRVGGGGGAQ